MTCHGPGRSDTAANHADNDPATQAIVDYLKERDGELGGELK